MPIHVRTHIVHTYMYNKSYVYVRYVSKQSVRKVSKGREITFEVLCGAREMYM